MKIELLIIFRNKKDQVAPLLPPDLAFLKAKMKEAPSHGASDDSVYVYVNSVYVSEELKQRIIEWGRTVHAGMSIIKSVGISEHYEKADLTGLEIVELISTSLDETGTVNKMDAFFARWDCPHCWRSTWQQNKDILVRPLPKTDFVISNAVHEMVVSGRLHALLKSCDDLQFRPLLNKSNPKEYVQVVMPQACEIVLERPTVVVEQPCPVCQRYQVVLRERYIEGQSSSSSYQYPYLSFGNDLLFSIRRPATAISICRSPTAFGRFQPSEQPPGMIHRVGEGLRGSNDFGEKYFASAELVGRLLDAGMTGIGFRPAVIAD